MMMMIVSYSALSCFILPSPCYCGCGYYGLCGGGGNFFVAVASEDRAAL